MKKVLGVIFIILGVVIGLYVGMWLLLILPIIDICQHIDANTITATLVGINAIKILLSSFIGYFIFATLYAIGIVLMD